MTQHKKKAFRDVNNKKEGGTYGEWYRKRKILIKFYLNFFFCGPKAKPLCNTFKNIAIKITHSALSIAICRTREKKQEETLESSMRSINASLIKKDNPVFYSRCGLVGTYRRKVCCFSVKKEHKMTRWIWIGSVTGINETRTHKKFN